MFSNFKFKCFICLSGFILGMLNILMLWQGHIIFSLSIFYYVYIRIQLSFIYLCIQQLWIINNNSYSFAVEFLKLFHIQLCHIQIMTVFHYFIQIINFICHFSFYWMGTLRQDWMEEMLMGIINKIFLITIFLFTVLI